VFFLRDPAKFPRFIHTQKRDPQTHLKDADMFWDYLSQNPESFHQVMILFGDRGVPDGFRFQHGYSGHTHKLVNANGDFVYAQFHYRTTDKVRFLTQAESVKIAGENPDYGTQDLFDAIERKEYPLRPVATLTLNENPQNYFAEIEQVAFSPSHLVPGVEATADPVLQSRLFSYPDTHRHRLGVNYGQLPVNAPLHAPANFQRDGFMALNNQGSRPNYQSSIQPLTYLPSKYDISQHEQWTGAAVTDLSEVTELDFEQPRKLWEKVFDDKAKERFVGNVSGHLGNAKSKEVKERTLSVFSAISPDLGARIAKDLGMKPVPALKVKPASEAIRFRTKFGNAVPNGH